MNLFFKLVITIGIALSLAGCDAYAPWPADYNSGVVYHVPINGGGVIYHGGGHRRHHWWPHGGVVYHVPVNPWNRHRHGGGTIYHVSTNSQHGVVYH